jgi:hypothetical protein
VCPVGFSLYRGYGNLLAERIRVQILGHAGWILKSYLHDLCDHDRRGSNSAMPMFRAFNSWSICRRLADSTASDRNRGTHKFTQVRPPEGKDLHPACLILYCLYSWSRYNGARMGSGYGRKRWRVLAYACDLCEIRCLCEISLSRGCPWWLYICSQLGFTSSFCLLLQVEVLGLAGFMYPLSRLLPWQEPSRLISRTRGVIPSSVAPECLVIS